MQEYSLSLSSTPLEALGRDESAIEFPTPTSAYIDAEWKVATMLASLLQGLAPGSRMNMILNATFSELQRDLYRILKVIVEVHSARSRDIHVTADPISHPLSAFLLGHSGSDGDWEERLRTNIIDARINAPTSGSLKDFARRWQSFMEMRFMTRRGRMDIHNQSPILDEYIARANPPSVLIRADAWNWPTGATAASGIEDVASLIVDGFKAIAKDYDISEKMLSRVHRLSRFFASERLQMAFARASFIETLGLDSIAGEVLAGGSPKMEGRLLNYVYRSMGKKVWRFAHSGDRAFFNDRLWPVSEFMYADKYFVNGEGEAEAFRKRMCGSNDIVSPDMKPDFVALGSTKHQRIWERSHPKLKRRGLKAVFVGGSFLAEKSMSPPDTKLPDPQLADLQTWVVRTLFEAGINIEVKAHPGGLARGGETGVTFGVKVRTGQFDPVTDDADVYIFDYAGSAFFDAIASSKGVVVLDMGNRPIAEETRGDLEARCEVVAGYYDDHGRSRFDTDELVQAINRAADGEGCPEWFALKYFHGTKAALQLP